MKVNAQQAAEILGVSKKQVRNYVLGGQLTDHRTRKEGAKKHYMALDTKEVRDFKASDYFKNQQVVRRQPPRSQPDYPTNGNGSGHPIGQVRVSPPGASGILTLLTQMNEKLDRLLKVWG